MATNSPKSVVLALAALLALAASASGAAFFPRDRPYIIGHRGASGYLPEHTLEAYKLAADMGADFIECDVVLSKDLVPICRHEPLLSDSTDADQKFPQLIKSQIVDGINFTGVFSTDMTLAQIKTLRAKERLAGRNQSSNGLFEVATLEEQIKLAQSYKRTLGIYPETKHPTWHDSLDIVKNAGTTMSDIVLQLLVKYGYTGPVNSHAWTRKPVFIQSFEVGNLQYLSKKTCIPLVQLYSGPNSVIPGEPEGKRYADYMTPEALKNVVSKYASGVGPSKTTILVRPAGETGSQQPNGASLVSTGFVQAAHEAGMQVHPYTWRAEPQYFAYGTFSSFAAEHGRFLVDEGIDGLFTDMADLSIAYLEGLADTEQGRLWRTTYLNARPQPKANNPGKQCSR